MIPISRETLRSLKAQKDEEIRQDKIKNFVTGIYNSTIRHAETSMETFCSWQLPQIQTVMRQLENRTSVDEPVPEFHRVNMSDILSELRVLFPDCTVELTTMTTGRDGKKYDISKMDEKIIPYVFPQHFKKVTQECIVIDWS